MLNQPLVARDVGCCEYNCAEEWNRPAPHERFNAAYNSDIYRDTYQEGSKIAFQNVSIVMNAALLGIQIYMGGCSKGLQFGCGLSFAVLGMGICFTACLIREAPSSINSEHPEYRPVPSHARCVNESAVIYSVVCLAFAIFSYMYISKDC